MADAEVIEIVVPDEYRDEEEEFDEFRYDEDSVNLVLEFSEHDDGVEALRELSRMVRDTFDTAWDGCAERREQNAKDMALFTGKLPDKNWPFKNCANVHIPSTFENLTRIHARMYGELFSDFTNVFGVVPVGPDDEERAELLSRHGNWQLREKVVDFRAQMHRAVFSYIFDGDVVSHSSYDSVERRNRHEVLTSDEFVTPYVYTSTTPDFSDVPYMCRVRRYYKHELEMMRDVWANVDDVLKRAAPMWEDEPEQLLRDAADDWEGIVKPDDGVAPYKIIEWEGWGDLPGQNHQRYLRIVFDETTGNILSLSIHEMEDWEDAERRDRQLKELQDYRDRLAVWEQAAEMAERAEAGLTANPEIGPDVGVQLGDIPPPPVPPAWFSKESPEPSPVRKVPIRLFAHGVCIEPMVGNQGFGFGHMQADFNRAMNTAVDQVTDAATLSNGGGGIIVTGQVEFDGGLKVGPGRVNVAKGVTAGELGQNIMPVPVGQPSQALIDLIGMVHGYAQSSMQAPDVLSGEPGKSGETYRGIATRVEQATKQLSVITRKFADPYVTQVFKNNGLLNAIYLDDVEMFMVNDHILDDESGQMRSVWVQKEVGKKMYRRSYAVQIHSDLKYGTDVKKIADADNLVQAALTVPVLQQNAAFQYQAVKKSLEARHQEDMIPYLGPAPPAPGAPMPAMPQQQQGSAPKPQE